MKGEAIRGWDHAYKISEDYVHSTVGRELSWHSTSSVSYDSDDALENWQNRLHEVLLGKCGLIMQSLCRIATDTIELPIYEGIPELSEFLVEFEDKVSEPRRLLALEEALNVILAQWWVTHKKSITGWSQCRILMTIILGDA